MDESAEPMGQRGDPSRAGEGGEGVPLAVRSMGAATTALPPDGESAEAADRARPQRIAALADGPLGEAPIPRARGIMPFAPPLHGALAAPPGRRTVAIAGISGGLGTLVMRRLLDSAGRYRIVGASSSPLEDVRRREVEFHEVALTQNRAEDIFRRGDIDSVVHLAFEDDPRVPAHVRYRSNVIGTMRLLDWCVRYGVRRVVIVSTAAVYGALRENPTLITEDFPVRADLAYPDIRDRVEVDRYASAWMWKYPEIETVILRPVHVVGQHVRNSFQHYVTLRVVPVLMGFDPMMQVVHEEDVARAIHLALERDAIGIFNIVGPSPLPLRQILREAGAEVLPVPHLGGVQLLSLLWRLKLAPFPPPQADFVRFPLVVSGEKARRELGYEAEIPLPETLRSLRRTQRR